MENVKAALDSLLEAPRKSEPQRKNRLYCIGLWHLCEAFACTMRHRYVTGVSGSQWAVPPPTQVALNRIGKVSVCELEAS